MSNKCLNIKRDSLGLGAVKKSIVRNVEKPIKENNYKVYKCSEVVGNKINKKYADIPSKIDTNIHKDKKDDKDKELKYKKPELNTCLNELTKKVNKIKIESEKKRTDIDKEFLGFVQEKITQQLNFPIDDNIYKGLVPINVNDSVLMTDIKKKSLRKKYIGRTNKDPEPELQDFLTQIEPLNSKLPLFETDEKFQNPNTCNFDQIYELYISCNSDGNV